MEEEAHPPGGVLAHDGGLVFAVSPRKQQAGRGTGWPDYHPPLKTPVVRASWTILHKLEAQYVHEEDDGRVAKVISAGQKSLLVELPLTLAGALPQPVRIPARQTYPATCGCWLP